MVQDAYNLPDHEGAVVEDLRPIWNSLPVSVRLQQDDVHHVRCGPRHPQRMVPDETELGQDGMGWPLDKLRV